MRPIWPNNQYATRVAIVPIYEQYFECMTTAQVVSRFQSALDAKCCPALCWSTMGDVFSSAKAANRSRDGVMPNPKDATVKRARSRTESRPSDVWPDNLVFAGRLES